MHPTEPDLFREQADIHRTLAYHDQEEETRYSTRRHAAECHASILCAAASGKHTLSCPSAHVPTVHTCGNGRRYRFLHHLTSTFVACGRVILQTD